MGTAEGQEGVRFSEDIFSVQVFGIKVKRYFILKQNKHINYGVVRTSARKLRVDTENVKQGRKEHVECGNLGRELLIIDIIAKMSR